MRPAANDDRAIGEAFIVGDDDPISFRTYFNGVATIAGKPPIAKSIPLAVARLTAGAMEIGAKVMRSSSRPLLTHTALAMVTTTSEMSMEKIKRVLGFRPRYDFAKAVAELRDWYVRDRRAA